MGAVRRKDSKIARISTIVRKWSIWKEGWIIKEYCHITIIDNGIGIEPQLSEKIFEVFQKLHGSDLYPGTGMGLPVVKKIIENHNGIIKTTSELGKGATFQIFIPAQ
jgi:two-component system, chemotaxis family, CheB/CheR fusion protein